MNFRGESLVGHKLLFFGATWLGMAIQLWPMSIGIATAQCISRPADIHLLRVPRLLESSITTEMPYNYVI